MLCVIEGHDISILIDLENTLIEQILNDLLWLQTFRSMGLHKLKISFKFVSFLKLFLGLGKLGCMSISFFLVLLSDLLKLFNCLLHAFWSSFLNLLVSLNFCFGSSSFSSKFQHIATSTIDSRYRSRLHEDLRHMWVHFNNLVSFNSHSFVAFLNSVIYPFLERLTNNCMDYIANILSFKFEDFFFYWKDVDYIPIVTCKFKDVFDC